MLSCQYSSSRRPVPEDECSILDSGFLIIPGCEGSRIQIFGNGKFFVGVLVVATGSKDRIIHHGLFDQGPIDEVLTRTFFGKVERVRVAGIFDRDGRKYLVLARIRTKKEAWIPLSSALFALLSSIGKQSDLSWGVS